MVINRVPAVLLASLLWCVASYGEVRSIDAAHSALKIRVFKSGFFSAFAHNHEIEAPIAQGTVEVSEKSAVALQVDARKLRVLDAELSADKRAEVQKTMDGPQVLDSGRFPEISFQSTIVETIGTNHWTVRGNLTLHGQSRPVIVDVALRNGNYTGSATLKQRDFGITPVSIAGGTVKVKDEIKIEFEVILLK
jgi:polyisoprenoid-binding protein YceI